MAKNTIIKVDQGAPGFIAKDKDGKTFNLSDIKEKWVVLYFYPKDDTPGCTIEAKEFEQRSKEFAEQGAIIFGVSPDSAESHCKFADKYSLTFTLLCDEEHKLAESYGVWREKVSFGKTSVGIVRTTVLIDPDKKIRHIWDSVKVEGHVDAVMKKLVELK